LKILVIYYRSTYQVRQTLKEHLYGIKNYTGKNTKVVHLNVFFGVPNYIRPISFDIIVYHYTFTALKWNGEEYFSNKLCNTSIKRLQHLKGYKIAIPQDEYVYSHAICRFFKNFGIKTVYTCLREEDWETVYPKDISGVEYFFTVPAGYIDEKAAYRLSKKICDLKERTIDIGYRVRKLPYWLGEFAQLKYWVSEHFLQAINSKPIKADISSDPDSVLLGSSWYKFLLSCKTVLGGESGASLHDPRGEIKKRVELYVCKHENADFYEVREHCFKGLDYNISLFALSPRHFECCMTKTCQILIEGDYNGILQADKHYIPVKKDFSNIADVIEKIKNVEYCQQIADNAYRDIVESGRYTYRGFVRKVLEHVSQFINPIHNSSSFSEKFFLKLLRIRIAATDTISPVIFVLYKFSLKTAKLIFPSNIRRKIKKYRCM
jgi:hypothetical protein